MNTTIEEELQTLTTYCTSPSFEEEIKQLEKSLEHLCYMVQNKTTFTLSYRQYCELFNERIRKNVICEDFLTKCFTCVEKYPIEHRTLTYEFTPAFIEYRERVNQHDSNIEIIYEDDVPHYFWSPSPGEVIEGYVEDITTNVNKRVIQLKHKKVLINIRVNVVLSSMIQDSAIEPGYPLKLKYEGMVETKNTSNPRSYAKYTIIPSTYPLSTVVEVHTNYKPKWDLPLDFRFND